MKQIRTYSYAKLNLSLQVIGRRDDGFHELSMLNVTTTLSDILDLSYSHAEETGIHLTVTGPQAGEIPSDDRNLVVKAAQQYLTEVGEELSLIITLEKNIPAGTGCGGGSSNAAAVLQLLQKDVSRPLSSERLHTLATRLGADVPYFLCSCPAWVGGIGEEIVPKVVPYLESLPCILVLGLPHSASIDVYREFRTEGEFSTERNRAFPESYEEMLVMLHNDLESSVRQLCPEVGALLDALRATFPSRVGMTGSGSGVFVLPGLSQVFSSEEIAQIEEIATTLGGWTQKVLMQTPKVR